MVSREQVAVYRSDDGAVRITVDIDAETVWLTQSDMAELFGVKTQAITRHLRNIYAAEELTEAATCSKMEQVRLEGGREVNRTIKVYNLDAVISVGYRVNSKRATDFRRWATGVLREYLVKGFALDDSRLKELGGGGYFRELLERIRDIRASEKVFYRQVLDIYATSVDYDPRSEISLDFFAKVQNKMHYAAHGQTAAETIYDRADAEQEFMGLRSFRGSQPHLADALVAKNYLDETELQAMNTIVSGYLDFAERQAQREQVMTMADWAEHLDRILTATGEELLQDAGKISRAQAEEKARAEYRKYRERTLSEAEEDFLFAIRELERQAGESDG